MAESIRKQLIIKLLGEGNLSIKQIAEKVNCTPGYVYNIRTEWLLQKAQQEKAAVTMQKLNKEIDTINEPKAFSHDWQPKWWQMLLMTIGGSAAIYFILVVIMSF
jgi:Homeodomain-like domain